MMTLRGAYDFIAIIEGSDFETMAGMKMLMQSTGTIEDMSIMEAVDFNKAAEKAAKKITEAAGGKLLEMMTLRGAYDFIAIIEGSDFETMAGMKMLMQSTGTIEDMSIMEAIDFNKAAEKAAKAAGSYRPVGK